MIALPPHLRYKFKPFRGSSHWWALKHLESTPRESRVLDIGSGSGAVGRALRERGFTEVFAVEIDDAARAHAQGDYVRIERSLDDFGAERFSIILLLDVLEHMPDPDGFMRKLRDHAEPGALVLVSVPNIVHWSIRAQVLCGTFDYTERGILDKTHLHFFSRKRVKEFLAAHELEIIELTGSIEPAEHLLPAAINDSSWFDVLRRARLTLVQIWPQLFAFQHLALCRVGDSVAMTRAQ